VVRCPSSKNLGLLSLFHNGGSGSAWIDVKLLGADGSSGESGGGGGEGWNTRANAEENYKTPLPLRKKSGSYPKKKWQNSQVCGTSL
jgi:hypothetical protein